MEDLRSTSWTFVTVPPVDQGSYVIRHEVPRNKILAADLQKGERYRVRLTNKCLGTRWWAFKSLEELEGVRLSTWKAQYEEEEEKIAEEQDPVWAEEEKQERYEKYGNGPSCTGEDPSMLAMIVEGLEAEFEIV